MLMCARLPTRHRKPCNTTRLGARIPAGSNCEVVGRLREMCGWHREGRPVNSFRVRGLTTKSHSAASACVPKSSMQRVQARRHLPKRVIGLQVTVIGLYRETILDHGLVPVDE